MTLEEVERGLAPNLTTIERAEGALAKACHRRLAAKLAVLQSLRAS